VIIKKCIEATLLDNYFLHFAGAWHESNMWKIDDILNKENATTFQNFYQYLTQEVSGAPIGMIKP